MARRKRGRKTTPPSLDFAFQRELIKEKDYKTFWPKWWKATPRQQEEIVADLIAKLERKHKPVLETPTRGKATKSLRVAQIEAKKIGGYIVRRDRFGRFNSRGRTFQALTNKPKGKRK